MKRFLLLLLLFSFYSCSDGELQIDVIDFDDVAIQFCESETTLNSTVFFKISGSEALILELQSGLLKNEIATDTIRSAVPSQSNIIYRLFTETVSKDYFCADIPPITPTVVDEVLAEAGEVLITTIQSDTDTTQFVHSLILKDITLVNEQGERITNTQIEDFGTITTQE
ncbi:MAG: hypothetical protein KJN96_04460 [Eudoraea sp.]|nr:hypothetical protein [Eudoraea sp.]